MSPEPYKVGILGCGTVGSAVARIILEQGDELEARIGRRVELVGVAVRDVTRERPGIPRELLSDDPAALANSGADIIIELIGGIEPARGLIMGAISHGSAVVTANKALLAAHGRELFTAATQAGVDFYYEAAVAGAIPIVRPLRESLVGDHITSVMGIVNGTTNYIVDKMTREGMDYATALSQAQELGYAEADPTADVEGLDAAAKAALLASLAFHTWVPGNTVHTEGITAIESDDIEAARELGYVVKLLAIAKSMDDGVSVRVHPSMVPVSHPLAAINGANNAVFVEAESAGRLMFMGPGAGGAPTASAVVGDLVTVARHRHGNAVEPMQTMYTNRPVLSMDEVISRYFVRMNVRDVPGVLAKLAATLAEHAISIETVRQTPVTSGDGIAQLYLMTHAAKEGDFMACIQTIATTDVVDGQIRYMRVEGA